MLLLYVVLLIKEILEFLVGFLLFLLILFEWIFILIIEKKNKKIFLFYWYYGKNVFLFFFFVIKVRIYLSSINRGNKKFIKDFRVFLINSVICSSNVRFFKVLISVMYSFSNNIKIWWFCSNNFSSCLFIIFLFLVIVICYYIYFRCCF